MTPERCAEIERMWAGGMGHVDILRDWVRELLTAMREAQHRVKVCETGLRGTGCEPRFKVIDALQRRVEGLEMARNEIQLQVNRDGQILTGPVLRIRATALRNEETG